MAEQGVIVWASTAGALVLIIVALCAVFCIYQRKNSQGNVCYHQNISRVPTTSKEILAVRSSDSINQRFTYAQILSITNKFSRVIGRGAFGLVCHGHLDDIPVVVKMLSPSLSEDYKDFKSEAEFLLRVHHQNLTSLLGYCDEGDKLGLIYEFMSNGDLHSRISDMNSKHLTWEERLHISLDAAQGLEHLHNGYKPPPLHKNIKSSNILLSENFVAKLAGFGLSRVSVDGQHDVVTAIMASPSGYLDPKYYYTERLDAMSDVFSLGIVLLEVITSKPVMVPTTDYRIHIRKWVGEQMTSAGGYDVKAILDSRLGEEYEKISAWKFVQVALACSSLTANERPTMSWVVNELRQCLSLEIARKREGLATDTMCEEAPFCSTLSSNQLVLS